MATVVGSILVALGLDSAQFKSGLSDAQKEMRTVQRAWEKQGAAMSNIGKSLSVGITAPVLAAGAAVVKMTGDFEASMIKVGISTKGSVAEMKAMNDLALKLGKDTTFGATQAADAFDMLAKNGLTAKQVLDGAATATVNLAAAAGSELSPAADAITDVMQQFKLTTGELPTVVNQITGAVNASKLSFEDFAAAIGQAGGVAGSSGVEFDDFTTALAATSSLFSSGADAGTSFKTFITSLTGNSSSAKAAIENMGLSFFDAAGNLKPMAAIAEELKTKLGGLSEEARTEVLKTIFGTDAMRTAIGLMDQGAAGLDKIAAGIAKTDAAAQAAKRMEGFKGQMENLKGAVETLAIRIGQSGLLESFTSIITTVGNFIEKVGEASPATLRWVTGLALVGAAIGPVLLVVGNLMTVLAPLAGLLSAAGVSAATALPAIGAVLLPLLPIIAAVAGAVALGYAAWQHWDEIAAFLEPVRQAIADTFGPAFTAIVEGVSAAVASLVDGPFGQMIGVVATRAVEQFGAIWARVQGLITDAVGVIETVTTRAIEQFSAIWERVRGPVAAIVTAIGLIIGTVFQQIASVINVVVGVLTGDFSGAWAAAKAFVSAGVNGLLAVISTLAPGAIEAVRNMVVGVKEWLVGRLGPIFDWVGQKIGVVKGYFHGLYDAVVGHSYIPDMVDGIAAQMARLDGVMVDPARKATAKVGDAMRTLATDTRSLLDELFPLIAEANARAAKYANIAAAEKAGPGAGGVDAATAAAMRGAMRGVGTERTPVGVTDIADKIEETSLTYLENVRPLFAANDQLKRSVADMADGVSQSLATLIGSIKGGGFLDILNGALGLLDTIGGMTKGGLKIAGLDFGGARANGGPVGGGKSYLVGERGPELFKPASAGRIVANDDLSGGRQSVTVHVQANDYFDAKVSNVADGRVAAGAPAIAAGTAGAMQRRQQRRYR